MFNESFKSNIGSLIGFGQGGGEEGMSKDLMFFVF